MKTTINNTNTAKIEQAFKNPYGMIISNTPEVREAVANHVKSIIAKLHAGKKTK